MEHLRTQFEAWLLEQGYEAVAVTLDETSVIQGGGYRLSAFFCAKESERSGSGDSVGAKP